MASAQKPHERTAGYQRLRHTADEVLVEHVVFLGLEMDVEPRRMHVAAELVPELDSDKKLEERRFESLNAHRE